MILADSPATGVLTGDGAFAVLWEDADVVTRSVLVLLGALLIAGLYILLDGLLRQRTLARQARTVASDFWAAPNLYEALKRLEPDSAYREVAKKGLDAATHLDGRLTDRIGTSQWIALSLDRAVRELSESLHGRAGVLALIAPAAVATGLAGMTWTLAEAFVELAARDTPDTLLLNVGEALFIVALGLVVAVTAAVGYAWLIQRNAQATNRVGEFAAAVRALLLSADRSTINESSDRPVPLPPRDRIRAAVNGPAT